MFKFVVFTAIVAIASAYPGYLSAPSHIEIHEPSHVEVREHSLAKVGQIIENVPTGVSGYSTSVVHDHAKIVTPIIAQGVKTRYEPAIRTYEAPVLTKTIVAAPQQIIKTVQHVPIVKTHHHIAAPVLRAYSPLTQAVSAW